MTCDHYTHVNMSFGKILGFFSMLNLFLMMMMMLWCFWGLKAASPVSFRFFREHEVAVDGSRGVPAGECTLYDV